MKASKFIGRWGAVCGVLLAGLFLAGCKTGGPDSQFADYSQLTAAASHSPAVAGAPAAAPGVSAAAPAATSSSLDTLNVGDSVTITYSDLPNQEPSKEVKIKEDGSITLIQNQRFIAAGKTRGALEQEIRERYVPKIYKNMTVSVERTPSTLFYYVGGEVKAPNRQVYLSRVTLLKAIQSAGDFTDFANRKKVQVTRAADGRTLTINCIKAQADSSLDVEIYAGDKIWVPRRIL